MHTDTYEHSIMWKWRPRGNSVHLSPVHAKLHHSIKTHFKYCTRNSTIHRFYKNANNFENCNSSGFKQGLYDYLQIAVSDLNNCQKLKDRRYKNPQF